MKRPTYYVRGRIPGILARYSNNEPKPHTLDRFNLMEFKREQTLFLRMENLFPYSHQTLGIFTHIYNIRIYTYVPIYENMYIERNTKYTNMKRNPFEGNMCAHILLYRRGRFYGTFTGKCPALVTKSIRSIDCKKKKKTYQHIVHLSVCKIIYAHMAPNVTVLAHKSLWLMTQSRKNRLLISIRRRDSARGRSVQRGFLTRSREYEVSNEKID